MKKFYYNLLLACLGIWVLGQTTNTGYGFYEEDYDLGLNVPYKSVTDKEGNTYVTGMSSDEATPTGNIFTIKVNPEGQIVWEVREPAVHFVEETGYAITLDVNDNPVVSGSHWNGHDMDMKTIKYNTTNGTVIWSSSFDGGHQGLDYPRAITIDMDGNVIVAGYSYYGDTGGYSIGYSVLKYNSQGQLLWSRIKENEVNGTMSKPADVAVDSNGNIAVTGYDVNADNYRRFYTVAYSATGDLKWANSYLFNSAGTYSSQAEAVRMDEAGNVYIVGSLAKDVPDISKTGIFKYSPDGDTLWENTYEESYYLYLWGHQIEIANETIYIAGSYYYYDTNPDYFYDEGSFLIAFDKNGEQQWIQKTTEMIQAQVILKLDDQMKPAIATWGFTLDWSNFSIKLNSYDTDGNLLFEKNQIIPIDTYSIMSMSGFGVDQSDNLYITLHSGDGEQGGELYEVQKFTPTGTDAEWVSHYANHGKSFTLIRGGQSDSEGNTLILGEYTMYYDPWSLSVHPFVMKQDAEENTIWKQDILSWAGSSNTSVIMGINSQDEIIVVTSAIFGSTITLRKYSPEGELIWRTEKEAIRPEMTSIVIDENDNIHVAGTSFRQEEPSKQQFSLFKYTSDGSEIWANNITSDNEEQMVYKLASAKFDLNGNLVAKGPVEHTL